MGEINKVWASMASRRDRQGLMRSAKAGQQWPWARLEVAGEGETMCVCVCVRERERERKRERCAREVNKSNNK